MAVIGIVATVLLAGCATKTNTKPSTSAIPIVIRKNASKPRPMTSIPASLGLLAPQVANYKCSGAYQSAASVTQTATTPPSEIGMPIWQLTITCVNPKLKFNLPKGNLEPGMVWIFEQPANANAMTLLQAIQAINPTSQLKISTAGKLPVGVGRLGFAGKFHNLLWFLGGKTSWTYIHEQEHGRVLVYLTGRAVSTATLKKFAQTMHPLTR